MTLPFKNPLAQLTRRRVLALGTATSLAALPFGRVMAQADWPSRPIRLLVPFPPGGSGDTSARAVGKKLGEILGQPITIDNKPGGNSVLAANLALNAPKDGYTFLWDSPSVQFTNGVVIKNLPFDYHTTFVPVSMVARGPSVLMVRANFPAKTFEEFLPAARAKPGTISCGTSPLGGMGHLGIELLQRRANIKLLHTAYKGGADAARDAMAGQIDSAYVSTSSVAAAIASGKCRPLAISSAQRSASLPDVPTIAENGFPGFDMDSPLALYAAAGTPAIAIRKIVAALAEAARDPALKQAMDIQGLTIVASSPAEFGAWQDEQRPILQKLVRDSQ
jgi:tripartite-type tricarboxylate transporter receptor subunit TctC